MKKFFVVLAAFLVFGAVVFFAGRPVYRNWKQKRLITHAQASLNKGDVRAAAFNTRQALAMNSSNIAACRLMAQITETVRSPATLEWRQRVVDLEPHALTNRLELARAAILQGNYVRGAQALQGVGSNNQSNVGFHQMAAMVAAGLNNLPAADRHFSEAARLDPENKLLQLNQAIIHLQAKDQHRVAGALKTLEKLCADPTYRRDALRHLAMAASRNKDYTRAAAFSKELQADPKAPLSDRLMHLTTLRDGDSSEFNAYLGELESSCANDADQVNTLTAWLLAHKLADEAARWLESLPTEMQDKRPVTLARADCFMARKDWPGLQQMLADAKWGELDFLRLAMVARARREQRQEFAARADWRLAVRAASDRPNCLTSLARMAKEWDWEKEEEEILWLIVQRFPAERWTLQALNRRYLATGNTRGLQKVYSTLVGYDAGNVAAQNNLAAVSLLLNVQTNKAHEMARAAYTRFPGNEAFASTYAYSLHLQGKTKDALNVFESLKPVQLEQPGVAVYYGAVLVASGDGSKAKKYIELAEKGQLLPEEKAILEQARKQL